jgi:hypothetical protein
MTKVKQFIVIAGTILYCFVAPSCTTTKHTTKHVAVATDDSEDDIHSIETTETAVPVPKDSAKLALLLKKDGATPTIAPGVHTMRSGRATVKAEMKHDTLYVSAECDSASIIARTTKEVFETLKRQQSAREETDNKDVSRKFSGFTGFLLIYFLVTVTLGGFLTYKRYFIR